jgi:hypothetical protein
MVWINGSDEIEVYGLDTVSSVIDRIAVRMKTLPKYVYFPEGIPTINTLKNPESNVAVEDLKATIIKLSASVSPGDLLKDMEGKISQQSLSLTEDIIPLYIIDNGGLKTAPTGLVDSMIFNLATEFEELGFTPREVDVKSLWTRRRKVKGDMRDEIHALVDRDAKRLEQYASFDNIHVGAPSTEFQLQKVDFQLTFGFTHIFLLELFNRIRLNTFAPFASVPGFYKILKDLIPPEHWAVPLENEISLRVLEKEELSGSKFADYPDTRIHVEGEPGEEIVTATLSLRPSGGNVSPEEFVKRLVHVLEPGISDPFTLVTSMTESQVNGVFYLQGAWFDKYVLADLALNNPLFSTLLSIDESDKASKGKPSVYIHFDHDQTSHVTANLTPRIVKPRDPISREMGHDIFPVGSRYVRVKISRAHNQEAVNNFRELLGRLFVLYDQDAPAIIEFYQNYIEGFGEVKEPLMLNEKELTLRELAPEVFRPAYTRKCPTGRIPTIISNEDAEVAQEAGEDVMTFPKPGVGVISRNYVCNNPKYPYPGLRENPFDNSSTVPFLPCCYVKDQEDTRGTLYRHYFLGEDLPRRKGAAQQNLYTTNKFVPSGVFGTLPNEITKMFDSLDYDDTFMFVREGVQPGKSSFLHCVIEALGEESIRTLSHDDEIRTLIYSLRERLAHPESAALCRQEMYDSTIDEIIADIANPEVYFDPSLFVNLLEQYYDCKIYIFRRDEGSGRLVLPRHLQSYYTTCNTYPAIFILEHWGGEADVATFPQCEIIARWEIKKPKGLQYTFEYDNRIAQGVQNVYEHMRRSYVMGSQIPLTSFPIDDIDILGQGFDSYGKCRVVAVSWKGKVVTLLTSPMPALKTEEIPASTINKISMQEAFEFAAELKMHVVGQGTMEGVAKEIIGAIGNVKVAIPIHDSNVSTNIPDFYGMSYPAENTSALIVYNRNKKLARYITDYIVWLYSAYMHEREDVDFTIDSMHDFAEEFIHVQENFQYGDVTKLFSVDSGVMSNGSLVVNSEEMLKRLLYLLRVICQRWYGKVISYYKRQSIEHFYVDVTDFDHYSQQVVLEGSDALEVWIAERAGEKVLHNNVRIAQEEPYFFKNDLVGKSVYLAQNTDSISKALAIIQTWKEKRYNPGEDPEDMDAVPFVLYSYANPHDITKFHYGGESSAKVLGYKIHGMSFYTALLSLRSI